MDHHLSPSVVGLLRGMLPDGWNYFEDNAYGMRCDGINISSQSDSSTDRDCGLRLITANKSIKISSLNPIMNIIKGNTESEKTSVYYFEVFVISGDCAVGFVPALDNNSHHHDTILRNNTSSSISVGNCGHLIHHPDAEFPLLQNNSQQNGETIGCGIIFGTEPTYFFTHNGVRIDVEAYGINSRLSSLQTALVPTVALSNSIETFVRTNFGFRSDTPFLWNGEVNNNLIISHSRYGDGSTAEMPPPSSSAVSNLGGGMLEVGGNGSKFPPLSNYTYLPGSISNDSGGGSLLMDEMYPLPNFTRGTTLSGAIAGQQQPTIPPMVEYAAFSSSIINDESDSPPRSSRRQRRRASMPSMGLSRNHDDLSLDADNRSIDPLEGISSTALPPPPFKGSQFEEEDELSSQFNTEEEELAVNRAFPMSDEAEFTKDRVFGKSSSATDVEFERLHAENDFDLTDVKELATELTRATSASGMNQGSVSQLIAVCEFKLGQLNDKITSSTGEDFGELLSVHDLVTEAVSAGKSWTRNLENQRRISEMNESSHSLLSTTSSTEQTNTEGRSEALRDIFGLLCHLRGRKEQTRIKAVRSLLSITRRGATDEQQQILQSGGLCSLLTLFQSSADSAVLLTASALNVANLVPSYTEPVRNRDIMAVIECLHYLIQSHDLDAGADFDITPAEIFEACVNAMTFVWMNYVEPKLSSSDTRLEGDAYDRNCFEMQRSRPKRRSFQDDDDVDYCHLLNSFTSLAVMSAGLDCKHVDGLQRSVSHGFAGILKSICSVEACRGLAMKEGAMNILLKWMRSKDSKLEVIAANALRDLTVPESSSYMAGWIHAELLHDRKAIADIVEGLSAPNLEVRRCMAEIVSCLSGVPHTRAAIIDAEGIKRLGQVLATADRGREDNSAVNVAVGISLLNLATCSGVYSNCERSTPRSKPGCILHGIMKSGAIESLASMSKLDSCRELRFLFSQLIRVVSEASCTAQPTQQLLCDAGVVTILGKVLSSDADLIKEFIVATMAKTNSSDLLEDSLHNDFPAHREISSATGMENAINELREVLRGLSNMFSMKVVRERNALANACSQFITSGGVESLQWVATMAPDTFATLDMLRVESRYVCDIRVDSCLALSSLCPILLSQGAGPLKLTSLVLSSLIQILKNDSDAPSTDVSLTIQTDALQGIVSLAECEALRTRIVDEFMPHLFNLYEHENEHVSDAAMQVCLALGFSAAEMGQRWDAYHVGDNFVFMRSLLIQSMVRDEIRKRLNEVWTLPLKAGPHGSNGLFSLFQHLCSDDDTSDLRDKVRKQFTNIYEATPTSRTGSSGSGRTSSFGKRNIQRRSFIDNGDVMLDENMTFSNSSNPIEDISLHALKAFLDDVDEQAVNEPDNNFLGPHQYPLSEFEEEKDWIVQHSLALNQVQSEAPLLSLNLPMRVNDLLRVYFPSALIREEVIPLHGLNPNASFDFRALSMPAGKYCSFMREGQMVSTFLQSETAHCHCTLGFRNSSFGLEFADSLLQTLYLCPAIQGLSFSNDPPETSTRRGASYHEFEGSELVANLVRTLPSSISHLTFDDVLSNNAALALAHNLQSMAGDDDEDTVGSGTVGSTKGFVRALAVVNSPYIKASTFTSLIETIQTPPRDGYASLFQSLRTLDLSGNDLGDDASARILETVLLPSSSHNIECLDLSRNGIKEGHSVKRTLEECQSSEPKLKVLNMSRNDLGVGDVASAIIYSLADVLSGLTSLDLSSNFLTGEVLDRLGGALPFNSRLENLNVSSNRFKKSSVDSLMSMLDRAVKSSSRLSFLHLDGNSPALTSKQEMMLSHIMIESRKRCISTHFEERSKPGKASVDESSTGPLSTLSEITFPRFDRRRRNMITVLFSAPLVWRDDQNNYYPIEMLDFELEKSLLWQCFTEASRNIDLSYDNATTDRLQAARTKGCGCLHYSGHGHPTHLTFEDGSGGIHWLEVDQLKDLILAGSESGKPPFNFVFVSACHSFLAGQTFVDAGVPHVVCCQQEAQLMDNAALSFTRAFYLALAFGRTVKESFEIGKQAVLNSPTVPNAYVEMEKFLLLPEDGNHDVVVLDAEPVPEWPLLGGPKTFFRRGSVDSNSSLRRSSAGSISLETASSEYKLPSLAQGFSGRETDMYHVLNLVLSRRLVNITGPSGMGRSSLAVALCHYIDERKSTMMFEQIYFVRSTAKRKGKPSPIFSLCEHIESTTNRKGSIPTNLDLDETVEIILRALRKTKTLLVFERIETLEGADAQDFQFFLGQILAETKDVHVLITSDKSLGLLQLTGVGEDMYELGPLNFRSTVKLFTFCCPHLQSSRERKELLDLLAPETDIPGNDESRNSNEVTEKMKSMLGDGIPARILSASYQMTVEEFNELKSLRL